MYYAAVYDYLLTCLRRYVTIWSNLETIFLGPPLHYFEINTSGFEMPIVGFKEKRDATFAAALNELI
jgi:hypothetical protein